MSSLSQYSVAPFGHGVGVETDRITSIDEDVQWVLSNLSTLLVRETAGIRLNAAVLRRAPSNSAIAMAGYAAENTKEFFEKFVHRRFPAAAARKKEQEHASRDLDPGLSGLEGVIRGPQTYSVIDEAETDSA